LRLVNQVYFQVSFEQEDWFTLTIAGVIMATILAGRFQLQDEVQTAIAALQDAGFAAGRIASFYVNPPGQHDMHPLGGDQAKSPGAEDTGKGTAAGIGTGGAIGAAVGAVATPVLGPVAPVTGAAVGAYAGSLMGSMSQTDEVEEIPDVRQAGMLLAVAVGSADEERQALDALQRLGAFNLERAQGQIVDGDWIDFDPLSLPDYVRAVAQA
jgi:hypothetical protein